MERLEEATLEQLIDRGHVAEGKESRRLLMAYVFPVHILFEFMAASTEFEFVTVVFV